MNGRAPFEPAGASRLCCARLWYAIGALLLLAVAVASLMPVPQTGIEVGDKLSHAIVYFVLGAWFALLATKALALPAIVVGLVVYGMLMEWLQGLTGYRLTEWADVLANASGALPGVLVYFTPLTSLFRRIDRAVAGLLPD